MAQQTGNDVSVSFDGSAISELTALSININNDTLDASSSFDDNWILLLAGKVSGSISMSGVLRLGAGFATPVAGTGLVLSIGSQNIGNARTLELSINRDVIDVSNKSINSRILKPGRASWNISTSAVMDFNDQTGQVSVLDDVVQGAVLAGFKIGNNTTLDLNAQVGIIESVSSSFDDNSESVFELSINGSGSISATSLDAFAGFAGLVDAVLSPTKNYPFLITNDDTKATGDLLSYQMETIPSELTLSMNDNEVATWSATLEITGAVTINKEPVA